MLISELLEDEIILLETTDIPRPAIATIEQRLADTLELLRGTR